MNMKAKEIGNGDRFKQEKEQIRPRVSGKVGPKRSNVCRLQHKMSYYINI